MKKITLIIFITVALFTNAQTNFDYLRNIENLIESDHFSKSSNFEETHNPYICIKVYKGTSDYLDFKAYKGKISYKTCSNSKKITVVKKYANNRFIYAVIGNKYIYLKGVGSIIKISKKLIVKENLKYRGY